MSDNLALVVSVISLLVAGLSALYARWSIVEARKSRKQAQSDMLAPHFLGISRLWQIVKDGGGYKHTELQTAKISLELLKYQLSNDSGLKSNLIQLLGWVKVIEDRPPILMVLGGSDGSLSMSREKYEIPASFNEAFNYFEEKQHTYLALEK